MKTMKTFIVHKKCIATDFISVKASSVEQAIEMADSGEGKSLRSDLEFRGYLPKCCWTAEDISDARIEPVSDKRYDTFQHTTKKPISIKNYPNGVV